MRTRTALAGLACVLAAGGCTGGDTTDRAVATTPAPVPTTTASPTPPRSFPPSPDGTGRVNLYAEAAYEFGLPQDRVESALTATRVEMVRVGGTAGERLHGEDEHPAPLNQSGHLDPRIVAYFAGRLGVPEATGHDVMEFLVDEWNEYDEQACQTDPNCYVGMQRQIGTMLHVSPARASWFLMLLISRSGPTLGGPDLVVQALARAAGVTEAQFLDAIRK